MSKIETLSTKQVAERAGVTVRTVARWVDTGRLTPVAQGPGIRGARMFAPADVDALLAHNEQGVA